MALAVPSDNSHAPAAPRGRLVLVSFYLSGMVAVLGCIALVGWFTDTPALKSVLPGLITMKINTALGLILLALSLAGLHFSSALSRCVTNASLGVVVLIAVLTLGEYATGWNLKLDDFLIHDVDSPQFPGRGAPATLFGLLGLVVAFALLQTRRSVALAQVILFVVLLAPLVTLGGYLYRAQGMYQHAPYPVIALNTAVALMLLCIGGLLARPDDGIMQIVISDSLAGALARKLLPASVCVPMVAGLLVLIGVRSGMYSSAFASSLLVAGCALFFGASACWAVLLLWRTELIRADAEDQRADALNAEREARAQAETANRMKDQFLSVVSHELRTPLNAILGWAQILKSTSAKDDWIQGLEVIERNARTQGRIVGDLLDMSQMVNGQLRLDPQPVELSELIQQAIVTMSVAAQARRVQLTIGGLKQITVCADPDRLRQILWNLLSNAIKFTPSDGRVTIGLDEKDFHAVVSVSDTGEGIAPEFLPHVFERFRQADSSHTRRHGGMGLGLSIVKHLTELHGGRVSVQSDGSSLGSTFHVHLPIQPPATSSSDS